MDPSTVDTTPNKNDVPLKASKNRKFLKNLGIIAAVALLLGASGYAGYWWRDRSAQDANAQKNAQIQSLQHTIATLKGAKDQTTSTDTKTNTTACTPVQPNATAVENIKASVTSGNTAALEGYMASQLTVLYAASDGVGSRTAAQAVGDVTSFIGSPTTVSWSFNIGASVLSSYGQGSYAQYFPGTAIVGKSSDGKVISFLFDCNGKIATVFMSASEDLLQ